LGVGFCHGRILGLFTAFWIEYAFVREFGTFAGGAYAAFLQHLQMSPLFIGMLVGRCPASISFSGSTWASYSFLFANTGVPANNVIRVKAISLLGG
jgi:hypothetical protein